MVFVFLPGILIFLKISLFLSLNSMLSVSIKNLLSLKTENRIKYFIGIYVNIHNFAKAIESAVSVSMLFLTCYQYSLLYIVLSELYDNKPETDAIFRIEKWVRYLQILLFLTLVVIASEVHEKDVALRAAVKDVAFQISQKNPKISDILVKFMNSKQKLSFSAWGMFRFTRGIYASSIGVLITYGLLLIQLNKSE